MDFVFSNSPHRTAVMTRAFAWAALDRGHQVFEERTVYDGSQWHIEMQNPEQLPPKNPFLYGHTGVCAAVHAKNCPEGWTVAWDPFSFDAGYWQEQYGDLMWNQVAILQLQEALDSWPEEGQHLRPCGADSGPKAFKAFFCDKASLPTTWPTILEHRVYRPVMRVAVSKARLPDAEYRLVFIHQEFVDGSLYLERGKLHLQHGAPTSVVAFAKDIAASHRLPSSHCVMDIGVDSQGMGIIEFNSLHSSGLYEVNRQRVVDAIAASWTI